MVKYLSQSKNKPKLLVCTPEIIFGLKEGTGNLLRRGINFSTGGMAPVNSKYISALQKEGSFDVYAATPKWESSLREFNELTTREIKKISSALPESHYLISHPSFNRVKIKGTNTQMYDDSRRFTSIDRAIAFSAGIVNTLLENLQPDIVWLSDWMLGPVASVAKAMDIKVVTTAHNIFTKLTSFDNIIYKGVDLRPNDNYNPMEWVWKTPNPENKNELMFDFMASAINGADDFTTVSNGFLQRLIKGDFYVQAPSVTEAVWNKLTNLHSDGRSRVQGVLNPLEKDNSLFLDSIEKDSLKKTIYQRKQNAKLLRKRVGLKQGGDLLLFPNRLYEGQKNPYLLINNAQKLATKYDLRVLFLANGDSKVVDDVVRVSKNSNGLVSYMHFDKSLEELAKQSDGTYGVMTSNYEPCGGPNLNYPVEGIPIIGHAIDGIKDTVSSFNNDYSEGNGFPFEHNDYKGLEYGVKMMKKFSSLNDQKKYTSLQRIATEALNKHSSSSRASQIVNDIFLPLYAEK